MRDVTERFSGRADDYVKYRPGYPAEAIDLMTREAGLTPGSVIADVGSGTGKLAELFLGRGYRVFGIEPNDGMRRAAEGLLAAHGGFTSIAGRAEEMPIPDGSVGLVVAGQAFHWFDPERSRAEFSRVLVPGGGVALVWNQRRTGSTAFLDAYDRFLQRHGTDYGQVARKEIDLAWVRRRLGSDFFRHERFENRQVLDLDGLRGRVLSCSYVPSSPDPGYAPMMIALEELFRAHQLRGRVTIDYDTDVYHGRPDGPQ